MAGSTNATPLAPPGVRVLAHAQTGERKTWATNAIDAWYVGPAMDGALQMFHGMGPQNKTNSDSQPSCLVPTQSVPKAHQ
jgi:hypothetical protein